MQNKRSHKNGKSRIDQIEEQLKAEEILRQQQAVEMDDEFIEEDIVQEDTQNSQKRIKPAKRIALKQKKPLMQVETQEQQLKDQQSKAALNNILKKNLAQKKNLFDLKTQQEIHQKLNQMSIQNQKNNQQNQKPIIQNVQPKIKCFYDEYQLQQNKYISKIENQNQPLNFFLSEIVPDSKKQDTLYLFGKIIHQSQGQKKSQKNSVNTVNGCIKVENIMREIYVVPRKNFTANMVLNEIKDKIVEHSWGKNIPIKYEIVTRNYCFEFDIDFRDQQVEVVKLSYSFAHKNLQWLKQTGETYKGIFGLTYKSEELFLLQNRIRGSEWVQVSHYKIDQNKEQSQDMVNMIVTDPQISFNSTQQNFELPKFCVSTLQVEFNSNTQKIDAICYSLYQNFDIQNSQFEVVDNFVYTTQQTNIEQELQNDNNTRNHIKVFDTEYQMLVEFNILFGKSNPDILVGHEIFASTLEVLLKRMSDLMINSVDLSRLKNTKNVKSKGNLRYQLREVLPGRLIFDLYELSKTMIKLDNYSLQDTIIHFFPDKISSQDSILEKLENNLYLLKIGDKLKVFYLTLQLSQVAGCLWEISLRQSRAQRNEILLLQEFYNRGYIIPDHNQQKHKTTSTKYSGGKVLDPKVGFYETYIILVDFNSLYPSIIRHYGICFSTVRRNLVEVGYQDVQEDDLEDMNDQNEALGCIEVKNNDQPILPEILERLINERKKAKSDLQTAKRQNDKEKEVQLDIKQQALKLIANSIYGCLGFSFSRFYAKKLAMMITYLGRKLLESSIELVENSAYEVIYGDTDSIMIQTGMDSTIQAVHEGLKIKKLINSQFYTQNKKQILEVELDGVFKKMLLLRKKKYAGLMVTNYADVMKRNIKFKDNCKLEVKGLDMVRRDWSELTRQVSAQVLNILMHNENAIDDLQQYLKRVNFRLDEFKANDQGLEFEQNESELEIQDDGNIPDIKITHGLFQIQKQLKKKTTDYADGAIIPHVKVAQDMIVLFKKTENQLINHYIPYVMTTSGDNQAEKAHHMGEYRSKLKDKDRYYIDFEFYKKNQLINPLGRLIEPIDSGLFNTINKMFGFSSNDDEVVPNEKAQQFQETVERARKDLGYYFEILPYLDLDDYLLACSRCDQFCYSFQFQCRNRQEGYQNKKQREIAKKEFDDEAIYQNNIYKTLKNILSNCYKKTYECQECNYKLNMTFYSKKCPNCKKISIVEKFNEKALLGKVLFFKKLCKEFSRHDRHEVGVGFFKETRQVIDDFVKKIEYESQELFQPFQKYIKQYNSNLRDKILTL